MIGIWHIRYFFFTFCPSIIYELERPALEDAHTLVQNWHLLLQIFYKSHLDVRHNLFLVPSLCKLNHISRYFIQISTKSPANCLFPSGKALLFFFWSHLRCFGPLGKFQHNIKISIKTARVSRRSISCDYSKTDKLQRVVRLQYKSSRWQIFFKIGARPANLIKRDSSTGCFLSNLRNF